MPSSARCAQRVDRLGALAHQQIARTVLHQLTLLLGQLDPHETHGRAPHRLTDRLGVGGIVLVALDVGLHVFCWHQPHPVAELRELARPIMSRGAGLHADEARRQRFEERQHLATPESLPDNGRLVGVDAVDLKHVLGDKRRKGGTYPLSHLYGHFGLVRLSRLGHDVPWVKA